jgi:uncharacterized protein (TIGR03382 family)
MPSVFVHRRRRLCEDRRVRTLSLAAVFFLSFGAHAAEGPFIEIHDPDEATASVCADEFVRDCSFDFGGVTVGSSRDFVFSIANTGGATLTLQEVSLASSPDFALVGATPTEVAVGASADVTVRYAPTSQSDPAGAVTIVSDAVNLVEGEDVVIVVSGSGVAGGEGEGEGEGEAGEGEGGEGEGEGEEGEGDGEGEDGGDTPPDGCACTSSSSSSTLLLAALSLLLLRRRR